MKESCIDNAVSYMKLAKDKVKNFLSQFTRVEKFQKTANSKSGKKGLFGPIINRIREAGGGNLSSLKCNGNSTNNGAQAMTNLTLALGSCEKQINQSCATEIPTFDTSAAETCKANMTTFDKMLKKCIALTGTDACNCWNDQSFTSVVASVKKCDFSAENKKMTAAKKSCIKAFGACRKFEDSVSEVISACSPGNSASSSTKALKHGLKNKKAASSFLIKINKTLNEATSRSVSNLTCKSFLGRAKKINQHLFNAPLNKKTSSAIFEILNTTIGSCSNNETSNLKTEKGKLEMNIEIIDEAMNDIHLDLKIQTGTTISVATLDSNYNKRSYFVFGAKL